MAGISFFYCEGCPAEATCTPASFKRAQVWGWTEEGAKAQLIKHLTTSTHHPLPLEDAESLASLVEWKTDKHVPTQHDPKRPRVGGDKGGRMTQADVVAETIRQLQQQGGGIYRKNMIWLPSSSL